MMIIYTNFKSVNSKNNSNQRMGNIFDPSIPAGNKIIKTLTPKKSDAMCIFNIRILNVFALEYTLFMPSRLPGAAD